MRNIDRQVVGTLSDKLVAAEPIRGIIRPAGGWIRAIRTATKRSRKQLAERLGVSTEAVRQLEEREASDSITLRSLREAANALDLQLTYILLPKAESLEEQIRENARKLATKIVMRTHQHMRLEDQEINAEALEKAITETTDELVSNLDQRIWNS